jgi:hypothetical protein
MRECRAEGCPHLAADGCDYCKQHDEPSQALPDQDGAELLPIAQPGGYMVEMGVHPHISHERDVPGMVAKMVTEVDRLGAEIARVYDADKNTTWREHAKALATRIARQRHEIHRLHRKVRDLRADIHERDEIIAALRSAASGEQVPQ